MAGSIQATVALLLAIPFVFWALNKYGSVRGSLYSALGGMMFLPEQVALKLPLLPEFDKHRIVLIGLLLAMVTGKLRARGPAEWWAWPLVGAAFMSGVLAWLTNTEALYYGVKTIPALNFKDGMYVALSMTLGPVLLTYVGMRIYRDERDLETWLEVLVGCGLVYSIFVLLEIRFSPQVHRWIYGFHAHESFGQTMRFGVYRPQVCMQHGLGTSLFMFGAAVAAVMCARLGKKVWRWRPSRTAWFLIIIVIACKSTGVWLYAAVALPLLRWGSAKAMVRTSFVIALLVCAYPYLRIVDQFPTQFVLDQARKIEEERMHSLKFRFDNEEILITQALKKPWFGWSANYGRNRLYDEWGKELTVTDGGWIIAFGASGVLGLFLNLGPPVFAIFTVWRRFPRIRDPRVRNMLGALTLYLALMLLDVIPNAAFNWLQFFLAGAVCGISGELVRVKRTAKSPAKAPTTATPSQSGAPAAA